MKEAQERANQQRMTVQEAKTSIKSSEMRANQAQALLRGQSSQRSKAICSSLLTGVIADIPTRVGEFAVAGLSTTSLMTIADTPTINVEVNVDETEIPTWKWANRQKVKVDALGDKEIKAVVIQKIPWLFPSPTRPAVFESRERQEAKEFQSYDRVARSA